MTGPSRLWLALFWLAALVAYLVAMMPPGTVPQLTAWDKLDHAAAFFVLTILARLAFSRWRGWQIGSGLAAFGGLIELSQLIPYFMRDASLLDWAADCAAILLALTITQPLARRRTKGIMS